MPKRIAVGVDQRAPGQPRRAADASSGPAHHSAACVVRSLARSGLNCVHHGIEVWQGRGMACLESAHRFEHGDVSPFAPGGCRSP